MVKALVIALGMGLAASSITTAQEVLRPGLIRAQLTLSPSFMLSERQANFFLHGTLEVYADERISIAGEGFYYLSGNGAAPVLDKNHSLFFGANYHFTQTNHDFYVGLQPGLAFSRLNYQEQEVKARDAVNPVISPLVGYNLYVHRIFHFFVQSRVVLGSHAAAEATRIDAFRISAGLGFNF